VAGAWIWVRPKFDAKEMRNRFELFAQGQRVRSLTSRRYKTRAQAANGALSRGGHGSREKAGEALLESFLLTRGRRKALLPRFGSRGARDLGAAIALALFLLAAGCTGDWRVQAGEERGAASGGRPVATLRAEDFFPAEPGMRWVYDGWGNEFAAHTRMATHRRGQRAQIVHVSGAIVAWVYDIYPDRITLRALRSEIEDEQEEYLDEPDELAWVILQEPLVEGARWRTPTFRKRPAQDAPAEGFPGGEFIWETRRIEGVGETLITPAGVFRNVIRVRAIPDAGVESLEYYAPGVGLIKSEYLYEERIISALARFEIGSR